jgi:hypothetical protein
MTHPQMSGKMDMAKKKITRQQTSAERKTTIRSKSSAGKAVTKNAPTTKTSGARSPRKSAEKTASTPARNTPSQKNAPRSALGRPLIPVDAPLEVVFEADAQAQDAFHLLQIETVRELLKFTPDELVQRLTSPAKQTVGRIRRSLAGHNRALSGDERFVVEFKHELKDQP